jgi:hypothetical protein
MKLPLVTAALAVASLYGVACGGSRPVAPVDSAKDTAPAGGGGANAMRPLPVGHYIRGDYDDDDNGGDDADDFETRTFGQRAGAADTHVVEELVRRYYAAAAAGNGRTACGLMDLRLARSRDYARVVPPEYAPAPGSSVFQGKTCAQIAALVFEPAHRLLVADAPSVRVTELRVAGAHALAVLIYTTDPESEIPLVREHGMWKVDAFLAAPLL